MSEHVTEWLSAYLDGELRGSRLQHVEEHLLECGICEAELESLQRLSELLLAAAVPEFPPADRFAAQVSLRLSRQQTMAARRGEILEIGWWMIPVGLLAVWIFMSTSSFIGDILSAAASLGLLTGVSDWLVSGSASQTYWTATLGQWGLLSGSSLDWAASTEAFTRSSLPQITFEVSIALLYLSWMAIWWARQRRREHSPLIERR